MRVSLFCALGALVLGLGVSACQPKAEAPKTEAAANCPDDGPRLPISGVCQGRAINYLENATTEMYTPEGCQWTVNEAQIVDEVLLYRALSCKGVTTTLEFAGGAQSAALNIVKSALTPEAPPPQPEGGNEPVRIFPLNNEDPKVVLTRLLGDLPTADQAKCEVQPADFGPGSFVIGLKPAERAKLPQDEPVAACGPYGVDEDSSKYWRFSQGYAWFFQLGQDAVDFDPASLMIFTKGADGALTAAPPPPVLP